MPRVKVGPKYQVVIPKAVRRKMGVLPGDYDTIEHDRQHRAVIRKSAESFLDRFQGSLKGAWDEFGGVEKYLENERNSWDN